MNRRKPDPTPEELCGYLLDEFQAALPQYQESVVTAERHLKVAKLQLEAVRNFLRGFSLIVTADEQVELLSRYLDQAAEIDRLMKQVTA